MIGLKQSKEFFYRGSSRFLCKKVLSFSAACARELPGCRSRIKSYDCEHGLKGRITRERKSCFLVSGRLLLIAWFLWCGLEVCLLPGEKAVVLAKRFSSLQNKWRRQFFVLSRKVARSATKGGLHSAVHRIVTKLQADENRRGGKPIVGEALSQWSEVNFGMAFEKSGRALLVARDSLFCCWCSGVLSISGWPKQQSGGCNHSRRSTSQE